MRERLALPAMLAATGTFVTAVHDYAYRRVDDGSGDYEFGGYLSHAGSDMLIVTIALSLVALVWTWRK